MKYPDDFINKIICGDCLEVMKAIPDKSIDAIITDLPYGTTKCKWDEIIPFDSMWYHIKRLLKHQGMFITTATQPFASKLIMSNPKWFKYEWIWGKSKCGSSITARYRPLQKHENVLVFGKGKIFYSPDMLYGEPYKRDFTPHKMNNHKLGIKGAEHHNTGTRFPDTILFFQQKWRRQDQIHPTQKPVHLYEYLIKTYTEEDALVLDFCLGSGTTAIACINTKRRFIGIEKKTKICRYSKCSSGCVIIYKNYPNISDMVDYAKSQKNSSSRKQRSRREKS